jgi:hypothetical protein
MMSKNTIDRLRRFEFSFEKGGAHISRTIMLDELDTLLSYVNFAPVSYALFLGYLNGVRGEALFHTEYAKLLDCSMERAIELAEDASRQGWIVFKRVGTVIEVLFPNLLTEEEMEWIRGVGQLS